MGGGLSSLVGLGEEISLSNIIFKGCSSAMSLRICGRGQRENH